MQCFVICIITLCLAIISSSSFFVTHCKQLINNTGKSLRLHLQHSIVHNKEAFDINCRFRHGNVTEPNYSEVTTPLCKTKIDTNLPNLIVKSLYTVTEVRCRIFTHATNRVIPKYTSVLRFLIV